MSFKKTSSQRRSRGRRGVLALTDDFGDILQAGSAVLEHLFEVSDALTGISIRK
jgi:hypothetical protein